MSKDELMALRKKREEMSAFDALGPLTRCVVSGCPELLDVTKISAQTGIAIDQLGLYDDELSASIQYMIDSEYGVGYRA